MDQEKQRITEKESEKGNGEVKENLSKKAIKRFEKEKKKIQKKIEQVLHNPEKKEASKAVDHGSKNYGQLEDQDLKKISMNLILIKDINAKQENKNIILRGRVHRIRQQGSKMVFLVVRQQENNIQCLLKANNKSDESEISVQMVKWCGSLNLESIILVKGEIKKSHVPIKSTTIQNYEILISKIYVILKTPEQLPLLLEDALRSEEESNKLNLPLVNLDTRLDARIIDLRTATNQAIFRIQSGICQIFREFLCKNNFIETHTPKLTAAQSESGCNIFPVSYFKHNAYLAQSPQLYKQQLISSDFERVFEIGPVFRAENSNTHRHLTEFVGLDLEMTFDRSYDEVVDLLSNLFIHIFSELESKYSKEIEIVKKQFPSEKFTFTSSGKVIKLKYKEALEILKGAGKDIKPLDDLSLENEKFLGELIKKKYQTDFYILDKFPLCIRPFYTMPCPENPLYSNSFDFFLRGEEVLSGSQRVHDVSSLKKAMLNQKIDPNSEGMIDYVKCFEYGCPPHAGAGIGLERFLMFFLNLKNIRRASLFPRDPKRLRP